MTGWKPPVVLFALFFIAGAPHPCASPDSGVPRPELIYIARHPCFGTCPVYRAWIFPDEQKIVFNGIRFTPDTGWFVTTSPDTSLLRALAVLLTREEWDTMQASYRWNIQDVPWVTVYFRRDGFEKKVLWDIAGVPGRRYPAVLAQVQKLADSLLLHSTYQRLDGPPPDLPAIPGEVSPAGGQKR